MKTNARRQKRRQKEEERKKGEEEEDEDWTEEEDENRREKKKKKRTEGRRQITRHVMLLPPTCRWAQWTPQSPELRPTELLQDELDREILKAALTNLQVNTTDTVTPRLQATDRWSIWAHQQWLFYSEDGWLSAAMIPIRCHPQSAVLLIILFVGCWTSGDLMAEASGSDGSSLCPLRRSCWGLWPPDSTSGQIKLLLINEAAGRRRQQHRGAEDNRTTVLHSESSLMSC